MAQLLTPPTHPSASSVCSPLCVYIPLHTVEDAQPNTTIIMSAVDFYHPLMRRVVGALVSRMSQHAQALGIADAEECARNAVLKTFPFCIVDGSQAVAIALTASERGRPQRYHPGSAFQAIQRMLHYFGDEVNAEWGQWGVSMLARRVGKDEPSLMKTILRQNWCNRIPRLPHNTPLTEVLDKLKGRSLWTRVEGVVADVSRHLHSFGALNQQGEGELFNSWMTCAIELFNPQGNAEAKNKFIGVCACIAFVKHNVPLEDLAYGPEITPNMLAEFYRVIEHPNNVGFAPMASVQLYIVDEPPSAVADDVCYMHDVFDVSLPRLRYQGGKGMLRRRRLVCDSVNLCSPTLPDGEGVAFGAEVVSSKDVAKKAPTTANAADAATTRKRARESDSAAIEETPQEVAPPTAAALQATVNDESSPNKRAKRRVVIKRHANGKQTYGAGEAPPATPAELSVNVSLPVVTVPLPIGAPSPWDWGEFSSNYATPPFSPPMPPTFAAFVPPVGIEERKQMHYPSISALMRFSDPFAAGRLHLLQVGSSTSMGYLDTPVVPATPNSVTLAPPQFTPAGISTPALLGTQGSHATPMSNTERPPPVGIEERKVLLGMIAGLNAQNAALMQETAWLRQRMSVCPMPITFASCDDSLLSRPR